MTKTTIHGKRTSTRSTLGTASYATSIRPGLLASVVPTALQQCGVLNSICGPDGVQLPLFAEAKRFLRHVENFPFPGIDFKDITGLASARGYDRSLLLRAFVNGWRRWSGRGTQAAVRSSPWSLVVARTSSRVSTRTRRVGTPHDPRTSGRVVLAHAGDDHDIRTTLAPWLRLQENMQCCRDAMFCWGVMHSASAFIAARNPLLVRSIVSHTYGVFVFAFAPISLKSVADGYHTHRDGGRRRDGASCSRCCC